MKIYGAIDGLGISLPSKVVTNSDLEKKVDTSDEWIRNRTGINERRIVEKGTKLFELSLPAVIEAVEQSSITEDQIDMIICATSTADMSFPSTACMIQSAIGAKNAAAFDILAACSGFVYGLDVANSMIVSGAKQNILLVGAEIMSRILDWEDRSTCILFGDGAAACIVRARESEGIIASRLYANGDYSDYLMSGYQSGSYKNDNDNSPEDKIYDGASSFITMKGNQTFKLAVKSMVNAASELLESNNITVDDIDIVVPHQANSRIILAIAKALEIQDHKVYTNLARYGNTSAATIPIALYEAIKEGRIKRGDLVLLVAFGGGFTWGATLIRW